MYLYIDTTTIPPLVELRERDDFTALSVVVSPATHAWIEPVVLAQLAEADADPRWHEQFAAMEDYAAKKGWLDEEGRLRAHIETGPSDKDA